MATAAAPMPRIKLHFSAGAYPPPPEEGIDEYGEMESEEHESSGDDDGSGSHVEEHFRSPTTIDGHAKVSSVDSSVLNAEPVAPFKPIRIILKAPKRRPDEVEETGRSEVSAPVRRKKKRRKSKTNHRRYDSSTSSEETYIPNGFQTLSGRTVINRNSRKEPSPLPPSKPPPKESRPISKSKSKKMFRHPKSRRSNPVWPRSSSNSIRLVRKPTVDPTEEIRLSILNARCVKCFKAADSRGDKIVFCDGCEKPYHQKCHRPNIDQSYIEVLEKNWYCYECAKSVEEEDQEEDYGAEEDAFEEFEEDYDEEHVYDEDSNRIEIINKVQAEEKGDKDEVYFRDVDTTSGPEQEENDYYFAEEKEQSEGLRPTVSNRILKNTINDTNTIQSENMEHSMKDLNDEQHKLFISSLSHSELVDLICRLRANGAAFDFNFPPGIKGKLMSFLTDKSERDKKKKRKRSDTAVIASAERIEPTDEVPSASEGEDDQDPELQRPEIKRRKFTASEEYWLWREDPENPAVTHIIFDNGVGRPAHEVNPPLFPYPGKRQSDASGQEKGDGGEREPVITDDPQN